MEKVIYLLWARDGQDPHAVSRRLLGEAAPELLAPGPERLSITWTTRRPTAILARLDTALAGYLVSESLYRDYGGNRHAGPRDWPDGQRFAGILTVTLLEKPERLSDAAWIAHWHGVQSPVSEETQPRTRYVRNEVVRPLSTGAPPLRGIVDEAWPSAATRCSSPERMRRNQARMLESVRGFLDLERIHSATMSEYLLES